MGAPLHVTTATFQAEVIDSPVPVLVDFFATWCGPCKMLAPIVEELATDYDGKLKVCKVDTDESSEVAAEHGIMGVPTVMIFKGGQVVDQLVGYAPKAVLKKKIDPHL